MYIKGFFMPKAFTHLFKDVNLSVFDNTLTVYKKSGKSHNQIQKNLEKLGFQRYIYRYDRGHDLYHQDDFKLDDVHYHAQFAATIDEVKLEEMISIFEKYNMVTAAEHEQFIKAFHDANNLPHSGVTKEVMSVSQSEEPPAKEKDAQKSLLKFKGGFFIAPSIAYKLRKDLEMVREAIRMEA
jgi:hypothetical protein